MTIYEPDIGFVLDSYEERFYEVLQAKDPEAEKETPMSLIGNYWHEIINNTVQIK